MESKIELLVRSTHIDVNRHVNNTKYLEYLEWAREDFYEKAGFGYEQLLELGVITVMVNVNLNYRKEALYNDLLTVITRPIEAHNRSFSVGQTIYRQADDALIADAVVTLATIDPNLRKAVPIPPALKAIFT